MMTNTPSFIKEELPAFWETISPAQKGWRFRDDFPFFNCCENAAEGSNGGHDPVVEPEEIGTFGLAGPVTIKIVTHRRQHILPRYFKWKCRGFRSTQSYALMFGDPPRHCIQVSMCCRHKLAITQYGVRCNRGHLPQIAKGKILHIQTLAERLFP